MKFYFIVSLVINCGIGIAQDLLLVIDEQFANKTFMGYDDLQGQILGELYWQLVIGESPYMSVDIGDGLGQRNLHYYVNPDELWTFARPENGYTTPDGLTMEVKGYPDINNLSPTANNQIGTAISYFYPWTFRRGYFEIKAKLPAGDGIQSAFHLFGDLGVIPGFDCQNVPGDQDYNWQEIDIWETGGSGPHTLRNNVHWSAALVTPPPNENFHSCDNFCDHCQFAYRGVDCETEYDFTEEFHTIGLYWDEQYVIFLLNGDIYRYWIKVPDLIGFDCNDHPDPIQTGNPRKILFTDAMTLNLGIGYGVSDGYDSHADPGNLNGPNTEIPLPESKLEVEYFRYWTFLPCEHQGEETNAFVFSNDPQIDNYHNDKIIDNYHERLYGHYETGRFITCTNTDIGPALNAGDEVPFWYSDQFNLIASRQINLQAGFHAKAASANFPIESQFHARIQTCATIPDDQIMPVINNMSDISGFTFLENFMASIGTMIFESYKFSGPLRLSEGIPDENEDTSTDYMIGNLEELLTYKIYPNPTDDKITCQFSTFPFEEELVLQLYNLQGEKIIEQVVNSNIEFVDMTTLPSGTYILKILSENEIDVFKIAKL